MSIYIFEKEIEKKFLINSPAGNIILMFLYFLLFILLICLIWLDCALNSFNSKTTKQYIYINNLKYQIELRCFMGNTNKQQQKFILIIIHHEFISKVRLCLFVYLSGSWFYIYFSLFFHSFILTFIHFLFLMIIGSKYYIKKYFYLFLL